MKTFPPESVNSRPWPGDGEPRRILAIRLQAHGDMAITLPYLNDLAQRFPYSRFDFLTRAEYADIPRSLRMFRRVFAIGGGRSDRVQRAWAALLLPLLLARRYEVVIDLQRNHISQWLRRRLDPPCWSEFDRYSPIAAGERTRLTLAALGLGEVAPRWAPEQVDRGGADEILARAGWRPGEMLVILNPAGHGPTRHWPIERFAALARVFSRARSAPTRFAVLGDGRIAAAARLLEEALGADLLDLTGKTGPREAFAIVGQAGLVVSEDSGLMHFAWVNGVPTIGIFGSSYATWSAPLGPHTFCFHSGDLECGFCLAETCARGDLFCLTRVTPAQVLERALGLVSAGGG